MTAVRVTADERRAQTMDERESFDHEHGVRRDGQIHLGPINLDGMTAPDLMVAAEHPALHDDVKAYARVKLDAFGERIAGRTERAMRLEIKAERLYQRMPEGLRW